MLSLANKRWKGNMIALFNSLKVSQVEEIKDLSIAPSEDRSSSNGFKLHNGRFQLSIRNVLMKAI